MYEFIERKSQNDISKIFNAAIIAHELGIRTGEQCPDVVFMLSNDIAWREYRDSVIKYEKF